jgi:hypothetical protein
MDDTTPPFSCQKLGRFKPRLTIPSHGPHSSAAAACCQRHRSRTSENIREPSTHHSAHDVLRVCRLVLQLLQLSLREIHNLART